MQPESSSCEQAADLFSTDNSAAEANKCWLKVAQYAAEAEDYGRAIELYEQVGGGFRDPEP